MLHHKILCLIVVALYSTTVSSQQKDSVVAVHTTHEFEAAFNKISDNKVFKMLHIPVPLFAISALTYSQGSKFRTMRTLMLRTSITATTISCNMPLWPP
ncbi:hypothetical protein HMPREF1536_02018 [Parabacteroides gordonii MS-1 = DSM 23371]|jgi:hypothetical protein|uniref:Uncharacterized protein n=1 Tax=Parabacteroides gordonii MS-1 = DSM 23371 TaxID=1203610 RepID=A0A0F5JIL0_9BACT|nr:hypothetical protein HMPREF1536_02018 [Parabacteroides gordonii MS-1 = DSM 23371]